MINDVWELVKQYYRDNFDIDESLVDLVASYDVLLLCASGAGNKTIQAFFKGYGDFEVTENDISLEIESLLGFGGWEEDLPYNPYMEYIDDMDLDEFKLALMSKYDNVDVPKLPLMFDICVKCALAEDAIQRGWK